MHYVFIPLSKKPTLHGQEYYIELFGKAVIVLKELNEQERQDVVDAEVQVEQA